MKDEKILKEDNVFLLLSPHHFDPDELLDGL
jgi:hypothetical protein